MMMMVKKKSNSVNNTKIFNSLRQLHISILQGHHQAALEYLKNNIRTATARNDFSFLQTVSHIFISFSKT